MFFKVAVLAVWAIIVAEASVIPVAPVVAEHHTHQPYAFGYNIRDEHSYQSRREESDGIVVRGNYRFTDAHGIQRQVVYVADEAGFRAEVRTNEPGTANQNPAAVRVISTASNPVHTPVHHHPVVAPLAHHPVVSPLAHHVAQISPVVAENAVVNSGAVIFDNIGYPRYGY